MSPPIMLSLRNTFRHKGRLALTLVTLTLGGAIFIAVFAAIVMWFVLQKTTFGYELKACGFLKIPEGENVLDNTWVHPENYALAEELLPVVRGGRDPVLVDFVELRVAHDHPGPVSVAPLDRVGVTARRPANG